MSYPKTSKGIFVVIYMQVGWLVTRSAVDPLSDKKLNFEKAAFKTDFCPLGCYRPIGNINFYAKFPQKSLFFKVKR